MKITVNNNTLNIEGETLDSYTEKIEATRRDHESINKCINRSVNMLAPLHFVQNKTESFKALSEDMKRLHAFASENDDSHAMVKISEILLEISERKLDSQETVTHYVFGAEPRSLEGSDAMAQYLAHDSYAAHIAKVNLTTGIHEGNLGNGDNAVELETLLSDFRSRIEDIREHMYDFGSLERYEYEYDDEYEEDDEYEDDTYRWWYVAWEGCEGDLNFDDNENEDKDKDKDNKAAIFDNHFLVVFDNHFYSRDEDGVWRAVGRVATSADDDVVIHDNKFYRQDEKGTYRVLGRVQRT